MSIQGRGKHFEVGHSGGAFDIGSYAQKGILFE